MTIHIEAPWEVNDYLQQVIHEKLSKLTAFNTRLRSADVFLKMGDEEGVADKITEIRLRLDGHELFAKDHATSFEKSATRAASKLRRQLEKLKRKH